MGMGWGGGRGPAVGLLPRVLAAGDLRYGSAVIRIKGDRARVGVPGAGD